MVTLPRPALPRPGTIARTVIDELRACHGGLSWTDLEEIYRDEQRKRYGRATHRDYIAMTLGRLLKRHAHKTGPSRSRAKWVFGQKEVVAEHGIRFVLHGPDYIERIAETPSPPTIDISKLEPPGGWPVNGDDAAVYESQRTRQLRAALEASVVNDRTVSRLKTMLSGLSDDERRCALELLLEEFPEHRQTTSSQ